VRVNAISPGFTSSDYVVDLVAARGSSLDDLAKAKSLFHRAGKIEEVAQFLLDVVSNKFINGSRLLIDGGIQAK
jgi:NAD(P)-dependent dehydrogenase (short-subunit alcohol dehydrogenase family)